jgi:hypothetical protein
MRASTAFIYTYDYTIFYVFQQIIYRLERMKEVSGEKFYSPAELVKSILSIMMVRDSYRSQSSEYHDCGILVVCSVPLGKYCDDMSIFAMITFFHISSNLSFINLLNISGYYMYHRV